MRQDGISQTAVRQLRPGYQRIGNGPPLGTKTAPFLTVSYVPGGLRRRRQTPCPLASVATSSSPRCDRVVPVAMESVADEVDCGELGVGHLDRFGVLPFIQLGSHFEARFGARGGDQLDNRSIGAQRLSAPIDRDE
jgi:hypothetical protein